MFTLKSFYKSKEWEKFRDVIINERTFDDGYVRCAHCGKPIIKRYDIIVHHVKELTEDNVNDYNVSLNPLNVEVIHFKCHNKIHARYGYEASKQVYIVYGAPCSGKSTWVQNNAQPNDLIVDMDSIYACIGVSDRYVHTTRLKGTVFAIRDKMYDIIKYRDGKWQNAYIITGAPLLMDRVRLEQRLGGASAVFIEATKEECLQRLEDSERPKELWQEYIAEWFERYQP